MGRVWVPLCFDGCRGWRASVLHDASPRRREFGASDETRSAHTVCTQPIIPRNRCHSVEARNCAQRAVQPPQQGVLTTAAIHRAAQIKKPHARQPPRRNNSNKITKECPSTTSSPLRLLVIASRRRVYKNSDGTARCARSNVEMKTASNATRRPTRTCGRCASSPKIRGP